MQESLSSNRRIAKNTLFLYLRQLLSLVVSVLTAGVMLNALGVTDYGINNVVGGVVGMVSFLTGSLASGSQRFLAFDMVSGDKKHLNQTFCTIALSYYLLGGVVILLSETVCVWFLNTRMNIPADRMIAANWVLQTSIFQFVLGLTTSPYMSVVIAHERMDIFAYVGLVNIFLRLVVLYLIVICPFDKLIFLNLLYLLISFCQQCYYQWYSRKHFTEARFHIVWDVKRMKELMSYSGWNMLGGCAVQMRSYGINILLNMFFNPAVNAARGIAYNVNGALFSFTRNYYMAVRPQIVKTFAGNEKERFFHLIFSSSRVAFFLLLILFVPFWFYVDPILKFWLRNPPELASLFLRLVLLNTLICVYEMPLTTAIQATGNIKIYHLTVSVAYLLILPVSYVFLSMGNPPETPLWVNLFFVLVALSIQLYLGRRQYGLPVKLFIIKCIAPTIITACLSVLFCALTYRILPNSSMSFFSLCFSCMIMFLITVLTVYLLGLSYSEKTFLFLKTKNILYSIKHKLL